MTWARLNPKEMATLDARAAARVSREQIQADRDAARDRLELEHPLVGKRVWVRARFTMDDGMVVDEITGIEGVVQRVYLREDDAVVLLDSGETRELPFPRLMEGTNWIRVADATGLPTDNQHHASGAMSAPNNPPDGRKGEKR